MDHYTKDPKILEARRIKFAEARGLHQDPLGEEATAQNETTLQEMRSIHLSQQHHEDLSAGHSIDHLPPGDYEGTVQRDSTRMKLDLSRIHDQSN
jgi:hypothetical protein